MTSPLPLWLSLAAAAEWLISLRPLGMIAKMFDQAQEPIQNALAAVHPLTFRGKLESALGSTNSRPDLNHYRILLARLENQLTVLSYQFDRAEQDVEALRSSKTGYQFKEMAAATRFANHLQRQIFQLLKEIQKTHLSFEKAASQLPQPLVKSDSDSPQKTTAPAAQAPPAVSEDANPEEPTTELISSNELPSPTESPQFDPQKPTEQEFLTCLVKNRHRIKNTPAKQRQSLILRLIEEARKTHQSRRLKDAAKTKSQLDSRLSLRERTPPKPRPASRQVAAPARLDLLATLTLPRYSLSNAIFVLVLE